VPRANKIKKQKPQEPKLTRRMIKSLSTRGIAEAQKIAEGEIANNKNLDRVIIPYGRITTKDFRVVDVAILIEQDPSMNTPDMIKNRSR